MTCPCEICTEGREIRDMIFGKDIQLLCKKVEELHNRWLNESADLEIYEAIFDGDWPNSVEILERALKNAKEKNGIT